MNEQLLDADSMNEFIDNVHSGIEIKETEVKAEIYDLTPQIRYDIPGCNAALVSGDPFGLASLLDYEQGDNPFKACGNCGLVSVSNLLRIAGLNVTEDNVTRYALDNKLCQNGWFASRASRGGTTFDDRLALLAHYGITAKAYMASDVGGEYVSIAKALEDGKGVLMGLNAGILWDEPKYADAVYGMAPSNHVVTVTGSVRNADTGDVIGFYICDSGRGLQTDACRYVPLEMLNKAYAQAVGANVIITDAPIRK